LSEAQRLAAEVTELTAMLCRDVNPGALKYALRLLGMMSPSVRLPLVEPGRETKVRIASALWHFYECCQGAASEISAQSKCVLFTPARGAERPPDGAIAPSNG
jgi:hypothetical protein